MISISFWQTREQTAGTVQFVTLWVQDNIGEMVVSVQNYVGDLASFSFVREI